MQEQTLGQWLSERCHEENMSLRETAQKTGLSHATIADITKGVRPAPQTIKKLSEAFGGNGQHRLVLEDKLLTLAGYRTPRPPGEEFGEAMAQLIDRLSGFSEPQLKLMERFADFISEIEGK